MNPFAVLTRLLVGACLLGTALGSAALSLGTTSGQVLVGRPLDVSVPLALDRPDQIGNLCLEVVVFYADRKLAQGAVITSVKPGSSSREAVVRVRVSEVVNEPIVSLTVMAGCGPTITRRYMLLADLVAVAPLNNAADTLPAVVPPGSVPAGAGLRPSQRVNGKRATTPTTRQVRPAAVPSTAGRQQQGPVRSTQPRLTLVPADFAFDRSPTLRPSGQLETPLANGVSGDGQRAAAAALWRALNLSPDDVLKSTERLAVLEADLKQAQLSGRQSQRLVSSLRSELAEAQAARYANGLVYGLLAICATLLALLVWRWRKTGRAEPTGREWWRRVSAADGADKGAAPQAAALAAAATVSKPQSEPLADSLLDLDLDLSDAPPASKNAPRRDFLNSNLSERMDFSLNLPSGSRAVNVEELFDVQQQADFFVSLGQHEQAIRVLRTHIGDNAETSALAYLDLFKLYHSLGDTRNYDALRVDFNQVFNARVPEFADYQGDGQGLEAYPQALARIQALWPSPGVLTVIEQSVFKRPGDDAEVFNLYAYRELLLLHAIAKEVVAAVPMDDVFISQPAELFGHDGVQDTLDVDLAELQEQARRGAQAALRQHPPDSGLAAPDAASTTSGNLIDFDDFDLPDLTKPRVDSNKPR